MDERELLKQLYEQALEIHNGDASLVLSESAISQCESIIARQESSKGVLAVLITLLLKKVDSPSQDIRKHQASMDGGFSGRGLDTRVVTPFMKEQNFPAMSESGWLTRSLEQSAPYTLDYPGSIRPASLKSAFLSLIDSVQTQDISAGQVLLQILLGLIEHRDRSANIALDRPVNLSVSDIVDKVRRHHDTPIQGASRLPVLAIHAALTVLTRELERYNECELLPLEHHNAADSRTNSVGDLSIIDSEGNLFEGYEIKHGIPITSPMIQDSFQKFRTTPVRRYYILTTHSQEDYSVFDPDIRQVSDSHGCQLIVNGIDRTLLYYLRLIKSTHEFVDEYVSHLENDASVNYQLKAAWNEIVQS